jgi:hypothetical protein
VVLTLIFALLAVVVVLAYLGLRQRRRDYEEGELGDDPVGDDWQL